MDFKLATVDLGNDTFSVAIAGEATLATAPELRGALGKALDAGAHAVLVDFSETTFIDSTALGVLMGAMKRLRPVGGELVIVCGDPDLRKVFRMTMLDRIFSIVESTADGLARVQAIA